MSNANIPTAPTTSAPTPPTPVNNQNNGYNWGQITAGPAAIAFTAVMQLASLMTKAMDMYNQQAVNQYQIQSLTATAAAKATTNAGKQQAAATMCEALNSFVGAGVSGLGLGAQSLASKPKILEAANENKAGLDNLQNSLAKARLANPMNGEAGTMTAHTDPKVQQRINELTSDAGTVTKVSKDTDLFDPTDSPKGTLNDLALAHMAQTGQLDKFSETFTKAQDINSREINDWYSAQENTNTKIDMYKGMVNGLTGAASQTGSSYFQVESSKNNAAATIQNSISQQQGSMASTSAGVIGKLYDEELQAYQLLQQMAASARAPV